MSTIDELCQLHDDVLKVFAGIGITSTSEHAMRQVVQAAVLEIEILRSENRRLLKREQSLLETNNSTLDERRRIDAAMQKLELQLEAMTAQNLAMRQQAIEMKRKSLAAEAGAQQL